ncbi:MAG: tetratricopeptide repeat protein [Thermoanaerobaculia bacterium]
MTDIQPSPWRRGRRLLPILLLGLVAVSLASTARAQGLEPQLAQARELLEAGNAESALALLDRVVKKNPSSAEALLARSTAHFVLGDDKPGRRDLSRALEADPELRQAWLNSAALNLADQNYDGALEDFERAERLDPAAADNDVNIGAVLILRGDLDGANQRFQRYLSLNPGLAGAFYLVATNYAMAGYAGLAIENLQRAVELDEKTRLRARTDPNFAALETQPRFQDLLLNDTYRPPAGTYTATKAFEIPYSGADNRLLRAVVDALQISGQPFDRRVEMTPGWALIWADFRIKVSDGTMGKGLVQISAAPETFTPTQWRERSEEFFRQVDIQLLQRGRGMDVP